MKPIKRKILSFILFFSFAFLLICLLSISPNNNDKWFYFNKSASLDIGIYVKIPDFILHLQGKDVNNCQIGDYVVFIPNDEALKIALDRKYISNKDTKFLKKVRGLYGDSWKIIKEKDKHLFYVNQDYCGVALEIDKSGKPMPIKNGEFLIPEGYFLPVGDSERSFDGRYTGVVKLSNIKAIVIPFFTGLHL